MNSTMEIGGYFGLELPNKKYLKEENRIELNTARNCLRYVIKAFSIKEIYLPFYTCPVVWQSVQKEGCEIKFYHIDKNFMPTFDFPQDAFILYTNYFGICAKNVKALASKYKNLIVDNAQAFYMPKYGIASFNSIRKFFGVSDGAFLYTDKTLDEEFDKDTSYQRFSHLLKRIDISAQFGYQDFCKNDDDLCNEEIKTISNLTEAIYSTIDIDFAKQKRLENFNYLHNKLKETNELNLELGIDDVPMVYPYLVRDNELRQKLIKEKIFVATYWNPQPEDTQEDVFQKYIIPLPIDQRYGIEGMNKILEKLNV